MDPTSKTDRTKQDRLQTWRVTISTRQAFLVVRANHQADNQRQEEQDQEGEHPPKDLFHGSPTMRRIPIALILSYAFIFALGSMYGVAIVSHPLILFCVWTPFCSFLGYRGFMIDYKRGVFGQLPNPKPPKIKFRLE